MELEDESERIRPGDHRLLHVDRDLDIHIALALVIDPDPDRTYPEIGFTEPAAESFASSAIAHS